MFADSFIFRSRTEGVSALPLFVAGSLLATGTLKVFFVATTTALPLVYEVPQWLLLAAVQAELLVGVLLLSGRCRWLSWFATLSLFFVFAILSLYRALAGYESCGCFGPFKVNPWWTFTLDVAILSLLVARRRAFTDRRAPLPGRVALCTGTAVYVLLAGLALFSMMTYGPSMLRAGESLVGDGQLVILEPTEWIDQEFPLSNEISPQIPLTRDKWIVLLYNHDCPKCREALPKYARLAREIAMRGENARVVLVEVPPYGRNALDDGAVRHARLSGDREWFVQAPIEIRLSEGKVQLASLDLPSVSGVR